MTVYPPRFEYQTPGSIDEAIEALETEGARILAGGHSLLPGLKTRTTDAGSLVDISGLDGLDGVEHDEEARETVIGATTTYADILADGTLAQHAPMVAEAIASVGDHQIRNRGTVCGNLVQADLGADVPAAAMAADARVVVHGSTGERTIRVRDLYPGDESPPVDDGIPAATIGSTDLVTTVRISDAGESAGAYERKTHPASGYALVGVATRVQMAETDLVDATVVATGVTRTPTPLACVEDALVGSTTIDPDVAQRASSRVGDDIQPAAVVSDPNVSGTYRIRLLEAYTERSVSRAIDGAIAGQSGGGHR